MAETVILLHGLGRSPRSMRNMEAALRRAGFATVSIGYRSRHKSIAALARDVELATATCFRSSGPVHLVTHSMGGIVAHHWLSRTRPPTLGRVVMLAPPHRGSELADKLHALPPLRAILGRAGGDLTTWGSTAARMTPATYPLGIIAGRKRFPLLARLLLPMPNDGKVTVRSTMLEGMADHCVLTTSHPFLVRNRKAIGQTIQFLRFGRFSRSEAA